MEIYFKQILFATTITIICISPVLGGVVPTENTCAGTLHEVRITDCTGYPCRIKRGKEYTVEVDFTPSKNTTKASVFCDTIYYGRKYRIPENDICPNIEDGCPLNDSSKYSYVVKFNVAYFVPGGNYPLKCTVLDDTRESQLCMDASGIIV